MRLEPYARERSAATLWEMGYPAGSQTDRPQFVVSFPPVWEQIEPLRQYIAVWVRAKAGTEGADRAVLVAQELLENAVKYGDPKFDVELSLSVSRAGQVVDVRVVNRAHRTRLTLLEREVQRNRSDDPRDAFARALERLQRLPEGSTMLGLSRVALESSLEVEIAGDFAIATARITVGERPAARPGSKVGSGKVARPALATSASGTLKLEPEPSSHQRGAGGHADPTRIASEPSLRASLFRK